MNDTDILKELKYTDGPCGLPKLWIWSPGFQKYMDCESSLWFALCNAFSPQVFPEVHGWSWWFALCNAFSP
ncbi:hypothetical protein Hanom_Chr07g00649501 [Helianthus anomalus]